MATILIAEPPGKQNFSEKKNNNNENRNACSKVMIEQALKNI